VLKITGLEISRYRLAGQEFIFPWSIPDFEPFGSEEGMVDSAIPSSFSFIQQSQFFARAKGLVGGKQREVEVHSISQGLVVKVAGGVEIIVHFNADAISMQSSHTKPSQLDREVIAGLALVLALAFHNIWSMHASAVLFKNKLTLFLGDSGLGKSTLAAYLASAQNSEWRLIADDILPVTIDQSGVKTWPHFPQLKLSNTNQPGSALPEHIPLDRICVLTSGTEEESLELQLLSPNLAVREFVSHTAGTRLFTPELLSRHLVFCAIAAHHVPVYRLAYPRRREALPKVMEILQNLARPD
jgi:hypothetical protein